MATEDVRDSRSVKRFVVDPPILATFAGLDVLLFDFAERGVQAEHVAPFRPGLVAKLTFRVPSSPETILLHGRIIWSHLSEKTDADGRFLYRSGLTLEDGPELTRRALSGLLDACMARPEDTSLERKREVMRDKARRRGLQRQLRVLRNDRPPVPDDQILLVTQARKRLRDNPDEAKRWYNRARFAASEVQAEFHRRDDVLAVWEYLERSVDLETITRVFDEHLRS